MQAPVYIEAEYEAFNAAVGHVEKHRSLLLASGALGYGCLLTHMPDAGRRLAHVSQFVPLVASAFEWRYLRLDDGSVAVEDIDAATAEVVCCALVPSASAATLGELFDEFKRELAKEGGGRSWPAEASGQEPTAMPLDTSMEQACGSGVRLGLVYI